MTRISLALAIARIFPPKEATRRFAVGLALLSTVFCLVIVTQSAVICAHQPALVSGPDAACQWPDSLRTLVVVGTWIFLATDPRGLTVVLANIFSDSLLVATPLYKLWRVRLPRKQRRLILSGFTASALTTSATVACAVFQFAPERLEPGKTILRGKLSYLEVSVLPFIRTLLTGLKPIVDRNISHCMQFARGDDILLFCFPSRWRHWIAGRHLGNMRNTYRDNFTLESYAVLSCHTIHVDANYRPIKLWRNGVHWG